jgi:S1-C subfamily serine protease
MPSVARICCLTVRLASALLLLAGPACLAAGPDTNPARRLEAVVRVQAEIPAKARTASLLGTERDGSGVVIDDAGLIVTIGYLITEAMAAEVTTAAGKASRAEIIGFDTESGLGLLRAVEPLEVKPMPIGTAKGLAERTPVIVIVAGHGGAEAAQAAVVVSRRTFAGYWEYLSTVRDLADFYRALWGRGEAGITVELTVNRQGEQHEIGVKTIDRYRYLKLGTTY